MTQFDARIREIVAYAYAHAPAIRTLMDQAGVSPDAIQGTADLARIPVLRKDELVEIHQQNPPFGGFLTVDPSTLPRIYISPGPIYDPQPPLDDPKAALAPFESVGFTHGDRVLNTFMYHLTPAGLLLDEGLRACGATVVPSGPGNTDLQIMMINALQINGFVGQPSYLMTILDKMESLGLPADKNPLKKALFSAEPYTPSQRQRFEDTYGMQTTSAYGTADLGFLGYTVAHVPGFKLLDTFYMQIVDPTTGEDVEPGATGEIVVTTFNKAYPLLRFGTGDLGALSPQLLEGRQHLLGLFGRSGEAIKVRGMFLHPNQLKMAAMQFPQIKRLQAVITRLENSDVVTLKLELMDGSHDETLAEKLKMLAQSAVRLRIDHIEFQAVGTLGENERSIVDARDWK